MEQIIPEHPLSGFIPKVADVEALKQSIDKDGLKEPIWVWGGQIVEGRVRYQAIREVTKHQDRLWRHGWPLSFFQSLDADKTEEMVMDWLVEKHIHDHQPDKLGLYKLTAGVIPFYQKTPGKTVKKIQSVVGLGGRTVQSLVFLLEKGNEMHLEKVLQGEIAVYAGFTSAKQAAAKRPLGERYGVVYGKGDKFDEVAVPFLRYMEGWRTRNFEFRAVPPKEAERRLSIYRTIKDGIDSAMKDLEMRAIKPRHTTK